MNPQAQLHLDAATRNQTIAERMLHQFDAGVEPPHDDWVITMSFYSALHLVDAFLLEHRGASPANHRSRTRLIESDDELDAAVEAYAMLKSLSELARYQPLHQFRPDSVQHAFDLLHEIRSHIGPTLDPD